MATERKPRQKKSVVIQQYNLIEKDLTMWRDVESCESTDHAHEWLMQNAAQGEVYRICTVQREVKLAVKTVEKRQLI